MSFWRRVEQRDQARPANIFNQTKYIKIPSSTFQTTLALLALYLHLCPSPHSPLYQTWGTTRHHLHPNRLLPIISTPIPLPLPFPAPPLLYILILYIRPSYLHIQTQPPLLVPTALLHRRGTEHRVRLHILAVVLSAAATEAPPSR